MQSVADMDEALAFVTIVGSIEFRTHLPTGRCRLVVQLFDRSPSPTSSVTITADDVSGWSVKQLGGGLSQLAGLHVADVCDYQHDRVRYVVEDLEHQGLVLRCAELSIERTPIG